MKHVASLLIFRNGMIAAFDDQGQQIAKIQKRSLTDILRSELEGLGYSVDGCQVSVADGVHVIGEHNQ